MIAYAFVLSSQPYAPPVRLPVQVWISTLLLGVSSLLLEHARHQLRRADVDAYRRALRSTVLLGIAFVLMQSWAGVNLLAQGVKLEANPRGSAFFIFSGLHGLHVIGGMIALAWVLRQSRLLTTFDEAALRKSRVRTSSAALYWHFMGVLWVMLLACLVLWSMS